MDNHRNSSTSTAPFTQLVEVAKESAAKVRAAGYDHEWDDLAPHQKFGFKAQVDREVRAALRAVGVPAVLDLCDGWDEVRAQYKGGQRGLSTRHYYAEEAACARQIRDALGLLPQCCAEGER